MFFLFACAEEEDTAQKQVEDGVLTLSSPAAGGWVSTGEVSAKGTAENCTDVSVNGVAATMSGGKYATGITLSRGVNVVEASALDERGDTLYVRNGVLAGDFATARGAIEDAMAVRVNQSGLDKVGDLVAGLLTEETVQAQMSAMNPIYSDSYLWDTITVAADVTQIGFDTPRIAFEPGNGSLVLVAEIPDFSVGLEVYGDATLFD